LKTFVVKVQFFATSFIFVARYLLWIVYDEKCKKEGPVNETFDRSVFFQLSSRDKFDLENIGSMYAKTTRANKNDAEKYGICKKLQEIYDSSKKYHHGADDGSVLGISWINPNEIEYYDQVLSEIITRIRARCTIRAMIA